jgi:hypothetical protein
VTIDDAEKSQAEIEVTPEMIDASARAYLALIPHDEVCMDTPEYVVREVLLSSLTGRRTYRDHL